MDSSDSKCNDCLTLHDSYRLNAKYTKKNVLFVGVEVWAQWGTRNRAAANTGDKGTLSSHLIPKSHQSNSGSTDSNFFLKILIILHLIYYGVFWVLQVTYNTSHLFNITVYIVATHDSRRLPPRFLRLRKSCSFEENHELHRVSVNMQTVPLSHPRAHCSRPLAAFTSKRLRFFFLILATHSVLNCDFCEMQIPEFHKS